jgi:hypothetical protein
MKIEVFYNLDGAEVTDIIERDCKTKEQAGNAALEYAKSKGSRHFPWFKIVGGSSAGGAI